MELRYFQCCCLRHLNYGRLFCFFYVLPKRINKFCLIIERGLVSLVQIGARFSEKAHAFPVLDIRVFGGELLLSIFLHENPDTAIIMEYSVRILKSAMGTGNVAQRGSGGSGVLI
jgi:hypothetical protein